MDQMKGLDQRAGIEPPIATLGMAAEPPIPLFTQKDEGVVVLHQPVCVKAIRKAGRNPRRLCRPMA
jgi:hypothetical protein